MKLTEELLNSSPWSSHELSQVAEIVGINISNSPSILLKVNDNYIVSFLMDMGASIPIQGGECSWINCENSRISVTGIVGKRQELPVARIKLTLPNGRPVVAVGPLSVLGTDTLKSQSIEAPLGTWVPNPLTQNLVISMGEISDEGSTAFLLQAASKLSQSTLTHVQRYHVWDLE